MSYQLSKELMKFIFSILVLFTLVIGLIVIISSSVSVSVDVSDVELYNLYHSYKNCNSCELTGCIKTKEITCEKHLRCKTYGLITETEVCI